MSVFLLSIACPIELCVGRQKEMLRREKENSELNSHAITTSNPNEFSYKVSRGKFKAKVVLLQLCMLILAWQ